MACHVGKVSRGREERSTVLDGHCSDDTIYRWDR